MAIRPSHQRALVVVALAVPSILVAMVYWPGALDADSAGEMHDVATGQFNDWHSPLLEGIWRIPWVLGLRGPGWTVPVSIFTLLVGLYLMARVRFSRLPAAAIATVSLLFPPVLTWAIHVGVDTWFTASLICAFGFTIRAHRTTGGARLASAVAAVWFGVVAGAARHNALPAVLVLFVTLAVVLIPSTDRRRRMLAGAVGVLATGATFGLQSAVQSAIGTRSTHPVQTSFIYDLAQLSVQEHRVLVPPAIFPGQSLQALSHDLSVQSEEALVFPPNAPIPVPILNQNYPHLQHAWLSAVTRYPGDYLYERLRVGVWMLSIGHPSQSIYDTNRLGVYRDRTGTVDPGPYSPKFPTASRLGYDYLTALTRSPNSHEGDFIYDAWIYAVILLMGIIVLGRRTLEERLVAAFAGAFLLYELVAVFAGAGAYYRYSYPMVVAAVAVAPILAAIAVARLAKRPSRPDGDRGEADRTHDDNEAPAVPVTA
jgi:hypothetical protein